MSDIAGLESNINQMMDNLNRDIEAIQKKDPSQRQKQISRCQSRLVEIRTNIEAYELEMLQLDKNAQLSQKEIFRGFQTRYKELKKQFDLKKAERSDDLNMLINEEGREKKLDEMTGQELVQVGDAYQQKGTTY